MLLAGDAPLRFYLGILDGEPVAPAELTVAGGVVGLYNIATLRAFRRRGIGSTMTLQPLLDGGFSQAVLQAAEDGVGVYRRLGFTTFGHITEYQPS